MALVSGSGTARSRAEAVPDHDHGHGHAHTIASHHHWRHARVFVSSTFRDTVGEREALVQQVFPRLREWAKDRHLHISEVDLRWGLTSEAKGPGAPGGSSMALAFDEIDRCDVFLGLLNGRYGRRLHKYNVPTDRKYSWVRRYPRGRSELELEIARALLNGGTARASSIKQGLLYTRSDAFLADVSAEEMPDFVDGRIESRRGGEYGEVETSFAEDGACAGLLKHLKAAVRYAADLSAEESAVAARADDRGGVVRHETIGGIKPPKPDDSDFDTDSRAHQVGLGGSGKPECPVTLREGYECAYVPAGARTLARQPSHGRVESLRESEGAPRAGSVSGSIGGSPRIGTGGSSGGSSRRLAHLRGDGSVGDLTSAMDADSVADRRNVVAVSGLEAWVERVFEDLRDTLDALFPLRDDAAATNVDPLAVERARHRKYAAKAGKAVQGRGGVEDILVDALTAGVDDPLAEVGVPRKPGTRPATKGTEKPTSSDSGLVLAREHATAAETVPEGSEHGDAAGAPGDDGGEGAAHSVDGGTAESTAAGAAAAPRTPERRRSSTRRRPSGAKASPLGAGADGHNRAIVVCGEPGIGKTSLVGNVATLVEKVMRARALNSLTAEERDKYVGGGAGDGKPRRSKGARDGASVGASSRQGTPGAGAKRPDKKADRKGKRKGAAGRRDSSQSRATDASGAGAGAADELTDEEEEHDHSLILPGFAVITHFVGSSTRSDDTRLLLQRLCLELREVYTLSKGAIDDRVQGHKLAEREESAQAVQSLWPGAMAMAAAAKRAAKAGGEGSRPKMSFATAALMVFASAAFAKSGRRKSTSASRAAEAASQVREDQLDAHRWAAGNAPAPSTYAALRKLFHGMLDVSCRVATVVLLIDGLDALCASAESTDSETGADPLSWLPPLAPLPSNNLRVLLTANVVGSDNADDIALSLVKQKGAAELQLTPLAEEDARRVLAQRMGEFGRKLSPEHLDAFIDKEHSRLPLFVSVAAEELKQQHIVEGTLQRIRELPHTLPELFEQVIARLESQHGPAVVMDCLSLLACAPEGLTERELSAMLHVPQRQWAGLRSALEPYTAFHDVAGDAPRLRLHASKVFETAIAARYLDRPPEADEYGRPLNPGSAPHTHRRGRSRAVSRARSRGQSRKSGSRPGTSGAGAGMAAAGSGINQEYLGIRGLTCTERRTPREEYHYALAAFFCARGVGFGVGTAATELRLGANRRGVVGQDPALLSLPTKETLDKAIRRAPPPVPRPSRLVMPDHSDHTTLGPAAGRKRKEGKMSRMEQATSRSVLDALRKPAVVAYAETGSGVGARARRADELRASVPRMTTAKGEVVPPTPPYAPVPLPDSAAEDMMVGVSGVSPVQWSGAGSGQAPRRVGRWQVDEAGAISGLRFLPQHLIGSGDLVEALNVLSDLAYIESMARAGAIHEVADHLRSVHRLLVAERTRAYPDVMPPVVGMPIDVKVARALDSDGAQLLEAEARAVAVLQWVQSDSLTMHKRPELTFQMACSQPDGSVVGLLASDTRSARAETRPFIRWMNKPQYRDPCVMVLQEPASTPITSLDYSKDALLLATGSAAGTLVLWDTGTGAIVRSFDLRRHIERIDKEGYGSGGDAGGGSFDPGMAALQHCVTVVRFRPRNPPPRPNARRRASSAVEPDADYDEAMGAGLLDVDSDDLDRDGVMDIEGSIFRAGGGTAATRPEGGNQWVLVGTEGGRVFLWDSHGAGHTACKEIFAEKLFPDSAIPELRRPAHEVPVTDACWSADGSLAATADAGGGVAMWRTPDDVPGLWLIDDVLEQEAVQQAQQVREDNRRANARAKAAARGGVPSVKVDTAAEGKGAEADDGAAADGEVPEQPELVIRFDAQKTGVQHVAFTHPQWDPPLDPAFDLPLATGAGLGVSSTLGSLADMGQSPMSRVDLAGVGSPTPKWVTPPRTVRPPPIPGTGSPGSRGSETMRGGTQASVLSLARHDVSPVVMAPHGGAMFPTKKNMVIDESSPLAAPSPLLLGPTSRLGMASRQAPGTEPAPTGGFNVTTATVSSSAGSGALGTPGKVPRLKAHSQEALAAMIAMTPEERERKRDLEVAERRAKALSKAATRTKNRAIARQKAKAIQGQVHAVGTTTTSFADDPGAAAIAKRAQAKAHARVDRSTGLFQKGLQDLPALPGSPTNASRGQFSGALGSPQRASGHRGPEVTSPDAGAMVAKEGRARAIRRGSTLAVPGETDLSGKTLAELMGVSTADASGPDGNTQDPTRPKGLRGGGLLGVAMLATSGGNTMNVWRVGLADGEVTKVGRAAGQALGIHGAPWAVQAVIRRSNMICKIVTSSGDRLNLQEDEGPLLQKAGFSVEADRVVAIGEDKSVRLYKRKDGQRAGVLFGHVAPITSMDFTHNGAFVSTCSVDGTVRVWCPSLVPAWLPPADHKTPVVAVAVSPTQVNLRITSASSDGVAKLYRIEGGRAIEAGRYGLAEGAVLGSGFTGSAASGFTDKMVVANVGGLRTWPIGSASQTAAERALGLARGSKPLSGRNRDRDDADELASAATGLTVVNPTPSLSAGKGLRLWAVSPTGEVMCLARADGKSGILLSDGITGIVRSRICRREALDVRALVFSLDGRLVVTATNTGVVQVWDVNLPKGKQMPRGTGSQASPDAIAKSREQSNYIEPVCTWEDPLAVTAQDRHVAELTWCADGKRLLARTMGNHCRVYNVPKIIEFTRAIGAVTSAEAALEKQSVGTSAFASAKAALQAAREACPTRDETVCRLAGHTDLILDAAWSPLGDVVVTGSRDGTLRLWDVQAMEERMIIRAHDGAPVAFVKWAVTGERVVSAGKDNSVRVWHARTGERLAMWMLGAPLTCMAIDPLGQTVVTGDELGRLRVLELVDPEAAKSQMAEYNLATLGSKDMDGLPVVRAVRLYNSYKDTYDTKVSGQCTQCGSRAHYENVTVRSIAAVQREVEMFGPRRRYFKDKRLVTRCFKCKAHGRMVPYVADKLMTEFLLPTPAVDRGESPEGEE